jgi:Mg/Co/Ni transporter MgtE
METQVTNKGVDSATAEMKEKASHLARSLTIGVVTGLVTGFLIAIWIAGADWMGTMVATSLAVMGASATLGGLMGANFAPE